nr:uncharacterized protein LOC109620448 [Crassostrea gigas]
MIHQQWMAVQCCLIIFPAACLTVRDPGNCTLPNSFSVKCCPGYFQIENKCKECEPGYIGENCSMTCPPGHYGRQCRKQCDCSTDMYCEPTRGCVCNTNSVNCTDPEHELTQEMTIYSTSMQSVKPAADSIKSRLVVTLLIPVIACLVFATVCIGIWYSQMMKRNKDLFSIQNVADFTVRNHRSETEEQNPNDDIYNHVNLRVEQSSHSTYNTDDTVDAGDSSLGLTSAVLLQQYQSVKGIQNKWRLHDEQFGESIVDEPDVETVGNKTTDREADIYSTPCKFMTKKPIHRCSEQRQQGKSNETVTFEYPNSIIDTIVHDPESRTRQFGESTVDEPEVESVDNKTTDRQTDIYSTPCKRMTKKPIYRYSEQRQGKSNETVTFEYPNSIIDTIVHEPESRTRQFGESIVDEPDVKTVDNKTTERQTDIYSTPCKRMTKKKQ